MGVVEVGCVMAMHGDGDTALMAVLTVEFVHSLMRILE